VAYAAIVRQCSLHMVRIAGAVEILLVTAEAVARSSLELVVDVARRTRQRGMYSRQRKVRKAVVVKACAEPGIHLVTAFASGRKVE